MQMKTYELHVDRALALLLREFASHCATPGANRLAWGALAAAIIGGTLFLWYRKQRTYLIDFECFRPPDECKVTYNRFEQGSLDAGFFDDDAMDFQLRILHKSGLSNETFFPPGLHMEPPRANMALAREEAELVMFNAVRDLLNRTGLHPRQVDVLVVNCSLFNPTPSLSAMIINHFKMRSDIESYNLGGMGCSAGIIAIGLARQVLGSLSRGGYALVVSTENITQNWYRGNERSMLIPNTIFRMGSAALLLSNKLSERRRARYELAHIVRVHLGADAEAYRCVFQHADQEEKIGVELNRDLVRVAGRAMEANLRRLGPLVLPLGEKLAFVANLIARKVIKLRVAPYVPDFRRAFDHFCLHAGGRAVVEGLSRQLGLTEAQMAPSANTLHWYGNTSSSTVWYSFGFVESVQGVRRGDLVWQIGFGSGFKCNSAVWRALKSGKTPHAAWAHIVGRENEAADCLKDIQQAAAREKAERETARNRAEPAGNGHVGEANSMEGERATVVGDDGSLRQLRNRQVCVRA
jgi:3-ketoacyl-CoA synthase